MYIICLNDLVVLPNKPPHLLHIKKHFGQAFFIQIFYHFYTLPTAFSGKIFMMVDQPYDLKFTIIYCLYAVVRKFNLYFTSMQIKQQIVPRHYLFNLTSSLQKQSPIRMSKIFGAIRPGSSVQIKIMSLIADRK